MSAAFRLPDVLTKDLNLPRRGLLQQNHLAHQHRLAAAVAAGYGEHLVFFDRQADIVMDGGGTETCVDMADFDQRVGWCRGLEWSYSYFPPAEQDGKEGVGDDDQKDRLDDADGGVAANAVDAARHLEPLVTTDKCDDRSEHRCLANPDEVLAQNNRVFKAVEEFA